MPGNETFSLQTPVATNFFVNSAFNDPRDYPANPNKKQLHEGVDLKAVDGQGRAVAVLAAQRGVVDKVANFPPGYGRYARVRHAWEDGTTYVTWYGHMSEIGVHEGQFVSAGDRLGIAGETGNASGVHLHLTLQHIGHGLSGYVIDDVVDPLPYFTGGSPQPQIEALYIRDETVPDGSLLQPGQAFTKTWRLLNSGRTAWVAGFKLAFDGQEKMGGPDSVPLPAAAPGQEVLVSVPLVAPTGAGRHAGIWRPRDAQGNPFNFPVSVNILTAGTQTQDGARFVADVTIPDGTRLEPGQTFLKQWRVRNSGTTTWNSSYRLAFFDDQKLSGPDNVPVPAAKPGEELVVSVSLAAPTTPGTYRSTWRLRNAQGQPFGENLFTLIESVRPSLPTELADQLAIVDDVTFEDGTLVQPGQAIAKVWRVRNVGDSTWGSGYKLAFLGDERMGGPESVPLPAIGPGQVADVGVQLEAPNVPGVHRSTWKPVNPQGQRFEFELFLEVEVAQQAGPGDKLDSSKFVKDVTILDGTVKQAGEKFLKTWRIRNTGTRAWGQGYVLAYFKDEQMGGPAGVPVPLVQPGEVADISVELAAPLTPGPHRSTWKLRSPQGQLFGDEFYALISVPTPVQIVRTNKAIFMGHDTFPPVARLEAGQIIDKTWKVRNTGNTTWGAGYTLALVDGEALGAPESVSIPETEPLITARVTVRVTAPDQAGRYDANWRLRDPQGNFFGPKLPLAIRVS